jgi:hypothetical protein
MRGLLESNTGLFQINYRYFEQNSLNAVYATTRMKLPKKFNLLSLEFGDEKLLDEAVILHYSMQKPCDPEQSFDNKPARHFQIYEDIRNETEYGQASMCVRQGG